MAKLSASLVGALLALALWLLLLSWDLSELDAEGRVRGDGEGSVAVMIAVVAGIVLLSSGALILDRRTRWASSWVAGGGLATWATLFASRLGSAETAGSNMFVVPLLFVVIPVAVVAPLGLRGLARRVDGGSPRRRPTGRSG